MQWAYADGFHIVPEAGLVKTLTSYSTYPRQKRTTARTCAIGNEYSARNDMKCMFTCGSLKEDA